ncbi:hypothetical protein [Pseudomonas aeruginosa]|uniref:hypothetical protein n=1 Tax=Pseudomonas aeruginosa TaxID=287 RepID=UPI00339D2907
MNAVWPAGGGGHRRVSSPAARQENHGAAPTSCSGSKRRSLNSLKNCLDRWVHFIDLLRKAGVQEMMIKTLVGHAMDDDTTINYGQNFSLAQRYEKLAQLHLDIDLSHIAWENYQRLQRLKPHCQKNRRAAS